MQPEVKWLMDYFDSRPLIQDMQDAVETLVDWSGQFFSYKSKNERIKEWSPTEEDFYDMVCHIFAGTLLHPQGMTYQAMIGYIFGNIRCKDPLDRAKCAAEVIGIVYLCELIVITQISDKTMIITTDHEIDADIPTFAKHQPLFKRPSPIMHIPILGNRFKQHGGDVCIDHINKMNAIPLVLETRIIDRMLETPTFEPETQEQLDQWNKFAEQSLITYQEVAKHDKFHLIHNHDTRGRCYCSGYYVNYQGSSFKKAIVQLADKEIVRL